MPYSVFAAVNARQTAPAVARMTTAAMTCELLIRETMTGRFPS